MLPGREKFEIREAKKSEYSALGELTVAVYRQLPGMPGPKQMPEYYLTLRDVAARALKASVKILVAVDSERQVIAGVTFIGDMSRYGAEASMVSLKHAAGLRLLAVDPQYRGLGLGRRLTEKCMQMAKDLGRREIILHTTKAMEVAWGMYQRMGFQPAPELNFNQAGLLAVYGFRLQFSDL